jgi:hypothetical protein
MPATHRVRRQGLAVGADPQAGEAPRVAAGGRWPSPGSYARREFRAFGARRALSRVSIRVFGAKRAIGAN